jgi:thiol:disulfide interchange protein DsbC
MQKSKAVWCAPDRGKAWIDYMARDDGLARRHELTTPIDKVLDTARQAHHRDADDLLRGRRARPGAMAIADFEKKLASAKGARSPRRGAMT